MHELSIAASIVELAQEEAESRSVRILAVHLRLGPLSGVVRHALLGSYEIACAGTALERSRLVIEDVPIVIFCAICGGERTVASVQSMQCPVCGAAAAEVLRGDELLVTALEVE
jgi:hydrogenase nickel incorporation protein HypA/HybF